MNDAGLARIKYYKGQMLTARDFNDQQEYHRAKQKHLLRRFPPGIIGGLTVEAKVRADNDPADVDGFLIHEGLAVDQQGNEIVITEKGLKVPFEGATSATPYLSLFYQEKEDFLSQGLCNGDQKSNRIQETVAWSWDAAPNIAPHITVALIRPKEEKDPLSFANSEVKLVDDKGGARVRIDARVVDTEQIRDGAITTAKLGNGAVSGLQIADDTIIEAKIADRAVTATKIADAAITASKIVDGTIIRSKLAENSVNEVKMEDGAVGEKKIANLAVSTEKLADGAVTAAKIAKGTITGSKIADRTIEGARLVMATIGENELADQAISGRKLADTAVSAEKLAKAAVSAEALADKAVTKDKLNLITVLTTGTFGEREKEVTVAEVPPNAILQVIPTDGALSYTFSVEFVAAGSLRYRVKIQNENEGDRLVGYQIRAIAFN